MPKKQVTQQSFLPPIEVEICRRLRKARQILKLSQSEVAARIKCSLGALKKYEYGILALRFGLAERFCREFEVDQCWLATGEGDFSPVRPISQPLLDAIPTYELFSKVYESVLKPIFSSPYTRRLKDFREAFLLTDIGYLWPIATNPIAGAGILDIQRIFVEGVTRKIYQVAYALPPAQLGDFLRDVDVLASQYTADRDALAALADRKDAYLKSEAQWMRDYVSFQLGYQDEPPSDDALVAYWSDWPLAKPPIPEAKNQEPLPKSLTSQKVRSSVVPYENPIRNMQNKSINQRIIEARKSLGLSQEEAAAKWKISLGSLRDWEQERSSPRGKRLKHIEGILADIERKHAR